MAKFMTMYMTSPISYHRIAMGGLRRLGAGIESGNKAMIKEGAREFFIAHMLLPMIFQAASNGFKFDTKEKKLDMLRAAVLGNFNNLFAIGDILDHGVDMLVGKRYDYQLSPVSSIGKEIGRSVVEAKSFIKDIIENGADDITYDDIVSLLDAIDTPAAMLWGIPAPGIMGVAGGITDVAQGETEGVWNSILRILGMSEYSLRKDENKKKKSKSVFTMGG